MRRGELERLAAHARLDSAGRPTPAIQWVLRCFIRPLVRVAFRPTLTGVENLPGERPYMLVANHGAAFAMADIFSLAVLWLDQLGTERPLAGFAHPFAFNVWPVSWFMGGLGAIPSTYTAGLATLTRGVPIVVFPGGDHEASQSVLRGNEVDFGGRTGFVRLAQQAGVPIVPMGIRGNHYPAPVLFRSRLVAWLAITPRLFGVKRYPVSAAAVVGALAMMWLGVGLGAWRYLLAWGWFVSPFALFPWVPWTIHIRIGAPIEQSSLAGELPAARDRVESAVRALARG